MKQHDLLILIEKYLNGSATEAESAVLEQYYNSFQQNSQWPEEDLGAAGDTEHAILQQLHKKIKRQQRSQVVPLFQRKTLRLIAALLLLAVGSMIWWMMRTREATQTAQKEDTYKPAIAHQNNTTLTLADGSVMVLDSLADGVLVTAETTVIRKKGYKVIIDPLKANASKGHDTGVYILKTPVGHQYEALLTDGSLVWLNAASSLRFPVVFDSSERRVQLTGEAYFNVAKDKDQPFKVLATTGAGQNSALVEVLGTQFNINAYNDEQSLKTTLAEGMVKVAPIAGVMHPAGNNVSILSPGQQAEIQKGQTNSLVRIKKVDVTEVVAWKDNLFNFNNTDLPGIMRQLARWYDVEVVYAGNVPVRHFSGKINRSLPLSVVLEILEQSNIRFKVKGKQIVVKS